MSRSIPEAISYEASKRFWAYETPETPSDPPDGVNMTSAEWLSLTPGYRREIMRQFAPKQPAQQQIDPVQAFKDRKAAVEYEARKRL